MDESAAFAVRGEVAGGRILETLDDRLECVSLGRMALAGSSNWLSAYRFSRSIVTDDQCERSMKLYGLAARVIEGANSEVMRWSAKRGKRRIC
jgi:hypothetical protein